MTFDTNVDINYMNNDMNDVVYNPSSFKFKSFKDHWGNLKSKGSSFEIILTYFGLRGPFIPILNLKMRKYSYLMTSGFQGLIIIDESLSNEVGS